MGDSVDLKDMALVVARRELGGGGRGTSDGRVPSRVRILLPSPHDALLVCIGFAKTSVFF